jgi:hypothetical protein
MKVLIQFPCTIVALGNLVGGYYLCSGRDCRVLTVKPVVTTRHSLSLLTFATYFLGQGKCFK